MKTMIIILALLHHTDRSSFTVHDVWLVDRTLSSEPVPRVFSEFSNRMGLFGRGWCAPFEVELISHPEGWLAEGCSMQTGLTVRRLLQVKKHPEATPLIRKAASVESPNGTEVTNRTVLLDFGDGFQREIDPRNGELVSVSWTWKSVNGWQEAERVLELKQTQSKLNATVIYKIRQWLDTARESGVTVKSPSHRSETSRSVQSKQRGLK